MKEFDLNNIPKIPSGLQTPDAAYFEQFSSTLMEQLPKNEPKTISLFQKNKAKIMMAAAILVVALAIPALFNKQPTSLQIDNETLENYLSYQTNINQYDLMNELNEEEINNINNIALEDQTIEALLISNNNLENYITE